VKEFIIRKTPYLHNIITDNEIVHNPISSTCSDFQSHSWTFYFILRENTKAKMYAFLSFLPNII